MTISLEISQHKLGLSEWFDPDEECGNCVPVLWFDQKALIHDSSTIKRGSLGAASCLVTTAKARKAKKTRTDARRYTCQQGG